jgi:hypothetical protein
MVPFETSKKITKKRSTKIILFHLRLPIPIIALRGSDGDPVVADVIEWRPAGKYGATYGSNVFNILICSAVNQKLFILDLTRSG